MKKTRKSDLYQVHFKHRKIEEQFNEFKEFKNQWPWVLKPDLLVPKTYKKWEIGKFDST